MDREYTSRYRDLYRRHWWWRAREDVVLRTLRHLRPPGGWERVLDIGCGGGVFFPRLEEFGRVEGVEPDASLIGDDADIKSRIYVGPFDAAYRPGHRFGLIVMLDVLEHLDQPVDALHHALELLEPGGVILLTVPAFPLLWTSHDVFNDHRTRYTKATLRRVAAASGLRFDHMEYFFHWAAGAKLAQHVFEKAMPGTPKPAAVPPRVVNALLYRVSLLEYCVARKLPVPFGSSLLAYASNANFPDRSSRT